MFYNVTFSEPESRRWFTNSAAISTEENSMHYDLSYNTRDFIRMVCSLGLLLPVCFIGIPANIFNCVVFWIQGLQDRMNLCLFALALADLLYLVITLAIYPVSSLMGLYDKQLGDRYLVELITILISPLYGFRATSTFIGVVIAVERCVCIGLPFYSSTLIRTRTMGIVIIISFFVFQLCYGPYALSFEGRLMTGKDGQRWQLVPSPFFKDNSIVLEKVVNELVDILIPATFFLVLIVVTSVTVISLKRAMSWRQTAIHLTRRNDSQQTGLTVMLLVVSVVHIVSMMPYVVCSIVYITLPDPFGTSYATFSLLKSISHSLAPVNSAFHMFIYYSRSSRFRQTIRTVLGISRGKDAFNK